MTNDSIQMTSVTVNTANIKALVHFYKTLGLKLESKQVTLGSEIYRAQMGAVELTLFGIRSKEKSLTPPIQLGFLVKDVGAIVRKLAEVPNVTIMMEPTDMPDGTKAIVLDPDGHSVELIQI